MGDDNRTSTAGAWILILLVLLLALAAAGCDRGSPRDRCVQLGNTTRECARLDRLDMLCTSGAPRCGDARSAAQRIDLCVAYYHAYSSRSEIPERGRGTGPGRTTCAAFDARGRVNDNGSIRDFKEGP